MTVAKKNEAKYKDVVERMRYYADLGIEFAPFSTSFAEYAGEI